MILAVILFALACPPPSPPWYDDPCHSADVNCDFAVNILDVIEILTWFGCQDDCGPRDIDDDNMVTVLDLIIVLENWGCCNVC